MKIDRRQFCCASIAFAFATPRIMASNPSGEMEESLQVCCAAMILVGAHLISLDHHYDERPTKINGGLETWELESDKRVISQYDKFTFPDRPVVEPERYGWWLRLQMNKDWGNEHWKLEEGSDIIKSNHTWVMSLDVKKKVFRHDPDEVVSLGQCMMRRYARGGVQQRICQQQMDSWSRVLGNET